MRKDVPIAYVTRHCEESTVLRHSLIGDTSERHVVYGVIAIIRNIDWASPQAAAIVVLLTIFALLRRWVLLSMTLLVITLARGLCHLQLNRELLSDDSLTLATLVYVVGGIVVVTVGAMQFLTKNS